MTFNADSDAGAQPPGQTLPLGFASSSELEKAGIRVTRAEFSRIMGCSKQAVTDWVKSGRIIVGCDGRFDPRAAVSQLLRTGEPARLRLRVLAPLAKEIAAKDRLIASLQSELAEAKEEVDFHRTSATQLLRGQNALLARLAFEWDELKSREGVTAAALLTAWLDAAAQSGDDPGMAVCDALSNRTETVSLDNA